MLELSGIGILAAFLAGVISFVSPCVLPLVPGYVSYVAGHSADAVELNAHNRRQQALAMSLFFVLGFSTVFMILGASATALGQVLLSYRYELNFVGGGIIILFGLSMIGMAQIAIMRRDFRFHLSIPGGRPASLLAAAFTDRLTRRLRGIGRVGRRLHQIAGLVMIAMGVAMLTGRLSALSYWLLDAFPILSRIG